MKQNYEEKLQQLEQMNKAFRDKQIRVVYINFIGPGGQLHSKASLTGLEKEHMDVSFIDGVGVNGRLIEGWDKYEEAEWLLMIPELDTLKYTSLEEKDHSAFLMSSFLDFPLDSRQCVSKVVKYANKKGLKPMCGIGICYEIMDDTCGGGNGVYKILPGSMMAEFNMEMATKLFKSGVKVEYFQPMGEKHNGLEFVPTDFLTSLDNAAIAKWYIEAVANSKKMKVKFSNPQYKIPMCEVPIHMSLWNLEGTRNLFFEEHDEMELSALGKSFIAGVLKYFKELTTIIALSSGRKYEMLWKSNYADSRNEAIIHVPVYMKERKKHERIGWGKRILFNGFQNGCNLHICSAAVLLAGIEGVSNNWNPADYASNSVEIDKPNKEILRGPNVFREVMGDEIIDFLLECEVV